MKANLYLRELRRKWQGNLDGVWNEVVQFYKIILKGEEIE